MMRDDSISDEDLEEDLRLIISTVKSSLIKRNSAQKYRLLEYLVHSINRIKTNYNNAKEDKNVSIPDIASATDGLDLEV